MSICYSCQKELKNGEICDCCCNTINVSCNATITYICPKCGTHCNIWGYCEICGWYNQWQISPPVVLRGPWKCPGCGRYHAPHVDTCPFCQPHMSGIYYYYPKTTTFTIGSCTDGLSIT